MAGQGGCLCQLSTMPLTFLLLYLYQMPLLMPCRPSVTAGAKLVTLWTRCAATAGQEPL